MDAALRSPGDFSLSERQAGVPMCFSATASFVTVGITATAGIVCLTRIRGWRELPLASLPLIFAGQQAVEGFLWLALPVDPNGPVSSMLTLIFLLYAKVVWPAFAPMAALLIEPEPRRRRLMAICTAIGAGLAAYFLWSIYTYPHAASIVAGHIIYTGEPQGSAAIGVLYLVATAMTPLLSSHRAVVLLGAIVFGGSVFAYLLYWEAFASVWCFFAAAGSGVILVQFGRLSRIEQTAFAGSRPTLYFLRDDRLRGGSD